MLGVRQPRSSWGVKSRSVLGALSKISDIYWIRWFPLPFSLHPARDERLENFKPSSRRVCVTSTGCKANTGAIGICVWLLFLLISCAIRLADEKRERCHHSWQRYHQAGARLCRAISYWWISEAGVMFCHGGYWYRAWSANCLLINNWWHDAQAHCK